MINDPMGDRMKQYEGMEAGRVLLPRLPVIVRLDGRAFHSWTSGLDRPFDHGFVEIMRQATRSLVEETNACIGYTQSDEISLVLWSGDPKAQPYFGGRVQKLVSVLASHATAAFNAAVPAIVPSRVGRLALFDCRAWVVPSHEEAANTLLWRERDAMRNSLQMLARGHFSHAALHEKDGADIHEMLHGIGVNWNDLPAKLKRGSWFQRRAVVKELSAEVLARIPEKHRPIGPIERHEIAEVDMPSFGRVTNRAAVIFDGATPATGDK